MKSERRISEGFIVAMATVAFSFAACYPDDSYRGPDTGDLTGLRLPLHTLGIDLEKQALERWIEFLNGDLPGDAFDMSEVDNRFALGLHLYSMGVSGEIGFSGNTLTLHQTPEVEELWVDLTLSDCEECWFEVVLFWRDDGLNPSAVNTFVGSNMDQPFTFDSADPDSDLSLTLDVVQVGEGTVDAVPGSLAPPAGARLAARDLAENVRLPAVGVDPEGSTLNDVPIGRALRIEFDPVGDGRFWSPVEEVELGSAYETVTVELP